MEEWTVDVQTLDSAALPVRVGDAGTIEILCAPYVKVGSGALVRLLKGRPDPPHKRMLLAASEALELRGLFNEALVPLEVLIRLHGADGVRDHAAARFGTLTLLYGLPADVRPIAETLDVDGRPSRGKVNWGQKGDPEKVIPAIERLIFGALALHRTAMNIGSERERLPYLQASAVWLDNAMNGSLTLGGLTGEFHTARCLYLSGTLAEETGDIDRAADALSKCIEISQKSVFHGLRAQATLRRAPLIADMKEREGGLLSAERVFKRYGNQLLSSEALFLRGDGLCEEGSTERELSLGIELMLSSIEGLDRSGYAHEAAVKRVGAALWMSRTGRHEEAVFQVRRALKALKKAKDDEMAALAMAVGFLALIRKGERGRAKRTLLELVLRYPVKQYAEAFEVLKEGVVGQDWLRDDAQTSDMFKDVPTRLIERGALNEIIARARDAHPNEFGAMLRGTTRITHIEPILETATGRTTVMFSLYDRLSQRSIPGEGVVHSHPSGSNRPSKADLQMFSRFPGINIIIGFPYTEETIAAYDRLGNRVELRTV